MIAFDRAAKAYRNRKGEMSWVFRDLSVVFPAGVSTGILAPRGQGKTTLIEIAAGNETPTEGRIYRQGRVSWPYTARGNISNKLTGKQNLRFMTDMYGRNFGEAYDFVRDFADLGRFLDSSLKSYNFEMRNRLAVATLFAMDFEYILVDESMDGGDLAFRKKCAQYLQDNAKRISLLIATSNTQIVTKYCQSAGVLNEGRLTMYDEVADAVRAFNKVNQVVV